MLLVFPRTDRVSSFKSVLDKVENLVPKISAHATRLPKSCTVFLSSVDASPKMRAEIAGSCRQPRSEAGLGMPGTGRWRDHPASQGQSGTPESGQMFVHKNLPIRSRASPAIRLSPIVQLEQAAVSGSRTVCQEDVFRIAPVWQQLAMARSAFLAEKQELIKSLREAEERAEKQEVVKSFREAEERAEKQEVVECLREAAEKKVPQMPSSQFPKVLQTLVQANRPSTTLPVSLEKPEFNLRPQSSNDGMLEDPELIMISSLATAKPMPPRSELATKTVLNCDSSVCSEFDALEFRDPTEIDEACWSTLWGPAKPPASFAGVSGGEERLLRLPTESRLSIASVTSGSECRIERPRPLRRRDLLPTIHAAEST